MAQASPNYSPPEILQAGYKAEMDGRIEYAVQFYRHLTDYYAQSPEAAEAREALQRISAGQVQAAPAPNGRSLSLALDARRAAEARAGDATGRTPPPQAQAPAPAATSQPHNGQPHQAAPRRRVQETLQPVRSGGYLIGRGLAVIMMVVALALIVAGTALLTHGFLLGFDRPAPGGFTTIVAGPSLLGGGIMLMLLSQLCLAVFRIAISTSELAALGRARAADGHEDE